MIFCIYTLHGSGAHWHLGHPTGKYPWEQVVAVQVYRHIGCTLTSVLKQNRWLLDSSEAIPASIDYIVKQSGINVFKLYNLYSVYVKRNSRRCILAVGIKTFLYISLEWPVFEKFEKTRPILTKVALIMLNRVHMQQKIRTSFTKGTLCQACFD